MSVDRGIDEIIRLRGDPAERERIKREVAREKREALYTPPQEPWYGSLNPPEGLLEAWGETPPWEAQMDIRGPMSFRHLLTVAKNGTNRLRRIELKPPAVIRGGIVAAKVLGSAAALILSPGSYKDADKSK